VPALRPESGANVLAPQPRDTLLQWLAREVANQQCRGARIVISDRWIEFHR
jgi:hypothetical protein